MAEDNRNRAAYLQLMYGNLVNKVNGLTSGNNLNAVGDNSYNDLAFQASTAKAQNDALVQQAKQEIEQKPVEESNDDFFTRLQKTFLDAGYTIYGGVLNFFDDIWDFGNDVAQNFGWISEEQAKANRDNDDWMHTANELWNMPTHFLYDTLGRAFTGGQGRQGDIYSPEYWQNFTNGSAIQNAQEQSYVTQLGVAGDILRSVGSSVGYMIPSMAAGTVFGEVGSLGTMGVGAFAGSADKEYNESGNFGKAIGRGILNAGIEIATEKAMDVAGKLFGFSTHTGIFAKNASKASKTLIGELTGIFLEEGGEEVASAMLEPFVDAIIEGDINKIGEKYSDPSFWVGGGESVLMQGITGGFSGIAMGGAKPISNYVKYGRGATQLIEATQDFRQAQDALARANNEKAKQKAAKELAEATVAYTEAIAEYAKQNPEIQNKNTDKKTKRQLLAQALGEARLATTAIDELAKDINASTEGAFKDVDSFRTELLVKGTLEYLEVFDGKTKIEYVDDLKAENGDKANALFKGDTLQIDSSLKNNIAGIMAHEVLGHAIFERYGKHIDKNALSNMYSRVTKTNWFKNGGDGWLSRYEDFYKNQGVEQNAAKKMAQQEVINKYFEERLNSQSKASAYADYYDNILGRGALNSIVNFFKNKKNRKMLTSADRKVAKAFSGYLNKLVAQYPRVLEQQAKDVLSFIDSIDKKFEQPKKEAAMASLSAEEKNAGLEYSEKLGYQWNEISKEYMDSGYGSDQTGKGRYAKIASSVGAFLKEAGVESNTGNKERLAEIYKKAGTSDSGKLFDLAKNVQKSFESLIKNSKFGFKKVVKVVEQSYIDNFTGDVFRYDNAADRFDYPLSYKNAIDDAILIAVNIARNASGFEMNEHMKVLSSVLPKLQEGLPDSKIAYQAFLPKAFVKAASYLENDTQFEPKVLFGSTKNGTLGETVGTDIKVSMSKGSLKTLDFYESNIASILLHENWHAIMYAEAVNSAQFEPILKSKLGADYDRLMTAYLNTDGYAQNYFGFYDVVEEEDLPTLRKQTEAWQDLNEEVFADLFGGYYSTIEGELGTSESSAGKLKAIAEEGRKIVGKEYVSVRDKVLELFGFAPNDIIRYSLSDKAVKRKPVLDAEGEKWLKWLKVGEKQSQRTIKYVEDYARTGDKDAKDFLEWLEKADKVGIAFGNKEVKIPKEDYFSMLSAYANGMDVDSISRYVSGYGQVRLKSVVEQTEKPKEKTKVAGISIETFNKMLEKAKTNVEQTVEAEEKQEVKKAEPKQEKKADAIKEKKMSSDAKLKQDKADMKQYATRLYKLKGKAVSLKKRILDFKVKNSGKTIKEALDRGDANNAAQRFMRLLEELPVSMQKWIKGDHYLYAKDGTLQWVSPSQFSAYFLNRVLNGEKHIKYIMPGVGTSRSFVYEFYETNPNRKMWAPNPDAKLYEQLESAMEVKKDIEKAVNKRIRGTNIKFQEELTASESAQYNKLQNFINAHGNDPFARKPELNDKYLRKWNTKIWNFALKNANATVDSFVDSLSENDKTAFFDEYKRGVHFVQGIEQGMSNQSDKRGSWRSHAFSIIQLAHGIKPRGYQLGNKHYAWINNANGGVIIELQAKQTKRKTENGKQQKATQNYNDNRAERKAGDLLRQEPGGNQKDAGLLESKVPEIQATDGDAGKGAGARGVEETKAPKTITKTKYIKQTIYKYIGEKFGDRISAEIVKQAADEMIDGKVINKKDAEDAVLVVFDYLTKNNPGVFDMKESEVNRFARKLFEGWSLTLDDTDRRNFVRDLVSDIFDDDMGYGDTLRDILVDDYYNKAMEVAEIEKATSGSKKAIDQGELVRKAIEQVEEMEKRISGDIFDELDLFSKESKATKEVKGLKELLEVADDSVEYLKSLNVIKDKANTLIKKLDAESKGTSGGTGQIKVSETQAGLLKAFVSLFSTRARAKLPKPMMERFHEFYASRQFDKMVDALSKYDGALDEELGDGDISAPEALRHLGELLDETYQSPTFTPYKTKDGTMKNRKHVFPVTTAQAQMFENMLDCVSKLYNEYSKKALDEAKAEAGKLLELVENAKKTQRIRVAPGVVERVLNYTSPDVFFAYMFGGTNNEGYKKIWEEGFKKPYIEQIGKANAFYEAIDPQVKYIARHSMDKVSVTDADGRKRKIRRRALYSAYLNSKSKDNLERMQKSPLGVAYHDGTVTRYFKYSELAKAVDGLSTQEKAQLDTIFNFYNDTSENGLATYAKNAMLKNIGFANMREGYYPISVADAGRNTSFTDSSIAGNMNANALMFDRWKSLSNNKTAIEINVDPIAMLHDYIDKTTISGEIGKKSVELSRWFRVKVDGKSVISAASAFAPNAREHISNVYNELIGNASVRKGAGVSKVRSWLGRFATATLGFNIRASMKQLGSLFTAWSRVGLWNGLKSILKADGIRMLWSKDLRNEAKQSQVFRRRIYDNGFVKGITLSSGAGEFTNAVTKKLANFGLAMVELTDRFTCYCTYAMCKTAGKAAGLSQEQIIDMFDDVILYTQSNSDRIMMSQVRSGAKGELMRSLFGMFQSDNQNKTSLLMRSLLDYKEAKLSGDKEREKEVGKQIWVFVVAAIMSGLVALGADKLADIVYDKKEWPDMQVTPDNVGEFIFDTAKNTVLSWIPYVNTATDWIQYGSVTYMPTEYLDQLIGIVSSMAKEGVNKENMIQLGKAATMWFGLPTNNIEKLINAVLQDIPGAAIKNRNLLYGLSSSYLTQQVSARIAKKNYDRAGDALSLQYAMYKTPISDAATKELVALKRAGMKFTVHDALTAIDGTPLTDEQRAKFNGCYKEFGNALDVLISSPRYSVLPDEQKALAISALSDAYYAYAKATAMETAFSTRLSSLVAKGADISNLVIGMKSVGKVASKQDAIKAINKLTGTTRGEKLLIGWLLGYTITDKDAIRAQLARYGFTRKEAEALVL